MLFSLFHGGNEVTFLLPFKKTGGRDRGMIGRDAGGAAAPPPASRGAAAYGCKTKFSGLTHTLVSKVLNNYEFVIYVS